MSSETIGEWVDRGIEAGFCEPLACCSHDVLMSAEEIDLFEDGWDPCVFVLKLIRTRPL